MSKLYIVKVYLIYMQSTSCEMLSWFNHKLESRWPGKISTASYMQMWRGTKEPLDEGERGKWKSWLKAQHWKTEIMVSCPITSWQIDGEKMETVKDFNFSGSKIILHGDYSHEIKRCLLLGRASLAAQSIKNLSAMQETCVRSLDWEDPLEKEMETHSSILAWRIQRTEEPGRLQSMGFHESDTT